MQRFRFSFFKAHSRKYVGWNRGGIKVYTDTFGTFGCEDNNRCLWAYDKFNAYAWQKGDKWFVYVIVFDAYKIDGIKKYIIAKQKTATPVAVFLFLCKILLKIKEKYGKIYISIIR